MYTLERAKKAALEAVRRAAGEPVDLPVVLPPAEVDADLAIPVFPLAAQRKKSPPEIAAELAGAVKPGPLFSSATASGGYLNLSLARPAFASAVIGDLARLGERYGSSEEGAGRAVVIDYSAPNVARPMSVGHLRSTIIGAALYNLHAFTGYRPIGDNHLGDWGTQFGTLLYAYTQWLDREAYEQDPIAELLRLYVKFDEEARKEPSLRDRAREWSLRLEQGDPEARRLWEEFVRHSLAEFQRTYELLEVRFDHTLGESFYEDKTGEVIDLAISRRVAVEDEGALIIRLDKAGITTPLLLRRRDGATLYHTRDLATAIYRIRTFRPSKILYVVGSDQRLHFRQLFAALHALGYGDAEYVHVDFGLVRLPAGRMSTRRGRVVFLRDVLEEAIDRARALVDEKNPELPEAERDTVARIVGVGAIKYADLSQSRVKNIVFDWDRMLSLEGDSAPYLQYTYVRARGIIRRAGETPAGETFDARAAASVQEWALIKHLARFPEAVHEATHSYFPHLVANYLFQLAQLFHAFYHEIPVLQAEDAELRRSRQLLVEAAATVMRTGLDLLGIRVPERM
jgi:arginyl-tRNA synthetase